MYNSELKHFRFAVHDNSELKHVRFAVHDNSELKHVRFAVHDNSELKHVRFAVHLLVVWSRARRLGWLMRTGATRPFFLVRNEWEDNLQVHVEARIEPGRAGKDA